MASHALILLHIVFSTKDRTRAITPNVRERLYEYVGAIVRGEEGDLVAIGGVEDHLHLLVSWRPDQSVSSLLQCIKSRSSGWIHRTFPTHGGFAWQKGYSVFSVSPSQSARVIAYIASQREHHRRLSFTEEIARLDEAHDIAKVRRFADNASTK